MSKSIPEVFVISSSEDEHPLEAAVASSGECLPKHAASSWLCWIDSDTVHTGRKKRKLAPAPEPACAAVPGLALDKEEEQATVPPVLVAAGVTVVDTVEPAQQRRAPRSVWQPGCVGCLCVLDHAKRTRTELRHQTPGNARSGLSASTDACIVTAHE